VRCVGWKLTDLGELFGVGWRRLHAVLRHDAVVALGVTVQVLGRRPDAGDVRHRRRLLARLHPGQRLTERPSARSALGAGGEATHAGRNGARSSRSVVSGRR